jgi:hypothetical protein
MLMGMALDPDWVKDMVNTYAELTLELQEILFSEEGYPDGIWYYEDMGFKERPFMSPAMYKEIIQPGHKLTFDYAHSKGIPVLVHSCGFVEPLVPGLIEAGMDCLQVIEVKAGMDLLRLYRNFGEKLSFMGGIDVRVLYSRRRPTRIWPGSGTTSRRRTASRSPGSRRRAARTCSSTTSRLRTFAIRGSGTRVAATVTTPRRCRESRFRGWNGAVRSSSFPPDS